jgi:hypothetical protein
MSAISRWLYLGAQVAVYDHVERVNSFNFQKSEVFKARGVTHQINLQRSLIGASIG